MRAFIYGCVWRAGLSRDFTAPGRGARAGGAAWRWRWRRRADDGSGSGRPSFVNVRDTSTRPVPPGRVAMDTRARRRRRSSPPLPYTSIPLRHAADARARTHTHTHDCARACAHVFALCGRYTAPKRRISRRRGRRRSEERSRAPEDGANFPSFSLSLSLCYTHSPLLLLRSFSVTQTRFFFFHVRGTHVGGASTAREIILLMQYITTIGVPICTVHII